MTNIPQSGNSAEPSQVTTAQETPPARRSARTLAQNLIIFLLAVIGIANFGSDRTLVKYHNEFVKEAYNAVFFKEWNGFIKLAQQQHVTGQALVAKLKGEVLPSAGHWVKQGGSVEPPQYASEFHSRFIGELQSFAKHVNQLIKALENDDSVLAEASMQALNAAVKRTELDINEFKKKLISEREITFEE